MISYSGNIENSYQGKHFWYRKPKMLMKFKTQRNKIFASTCLNSGNKKVAAHHGTCL
jgi:hypothetical protein